MDIRSKKLRKLVIMGLAGGNRGHIGPSMSLVEILRVLFDNLLKFNSKKPKWEKRDRFILSKGHGCLALYSILIDKGFSIEQISLVSASYISVSIISLFFIRKNLNPIKIT